MSVVGSPSTPRKDPHHFLEAQDRKDLSKGGQESGYSTPEGQQQKPKKVIYEVVVWCVLPSYTSYFIQKINQSEQEEMSCDFKTELICRLKWSRSDRTIPWEFDLELILVRWHGNSWIGGLYECDLTECCEPHVLPYSWDVDHHHFDPSLWCCLYWGLVGNNYGWPSNYSKMVLFSLFFTVDVSCMCIQTKTWEPSAIKVHILLYAVWSRFKKEQSVFTITIIWYVCFFNVHFYDTDFCSNKSEKKKTRMCIGATHTRHVSHNYSTSLKHF